MAYYKNITYKDIKNDSLVTHILDNKVIAVFKYDNNVYANGFKIVNYINDEPNDLEAINSIELGAGKHTRNKLYDLLFN